MPVSTGSGCGRVRRRRGGGAGLPTAADTAAERDVSPVVASSGAEPALLLSAGDAAHLCGASERTWRTWDAAGRIPRPVAIGRAKFWRRGELEAWIQRRCPPRQTWDVIFEEDSP